MKLSRNRLQQIINTHTIQTRKKFKKNTRVLKHTNTVRTNTKTKTFNLLNRTIKNFS